MHTVTKILPASLVLCLFAAAPIAYAATSPGPDATTTFGVLSSTYTNTAIGTTINGDLGYTTPPAVAPTVNGTTHKTDTTYAQAGIDQGSELGALNTQPCTFTFAPGAIDLASDATHGTVGIYVPGVYCITGAAAIGGGGTITLTGSGTYIFRMTGALTTSANSVVAAASGASACNIWWTPGAATTLGANSTFLGTDIDAAGVTVGNLITWTGRALAFGGTVSTSRDTISVPTCTTSTGPTSTPTATPTPTLKPGSTTPPVPGTGAGSPPAGLPWWALPALIVAGLATVRLGRRTEQP